MFVYTPLYHQHPQQCQATQSGLRERAEWMHDLCQMLPRVQYNRAKVLLSPRYALGAVLSRAQAVKETTRARLLTSRSLPHSNTASSPPCCPSAVARTMSGQVLWTAVSGVWNQIRIWSLPPWALWSQGDLFKKFNLKIFTMVCFLKLTLYNLKQKQKIHTKLIFKND